MFEIEQAGAVDEFIDHPRGQVFGDVPGGRDWLREYGESGHDVFSEAAPIVGCLYHDQRGIQVGIWFTHGGDDAVSSILGWTEIHEQHLVLGVMDDGVEFRAKAGQVGGCELAFEDGILDVVAGLAEGLEDLPEAFVVADVVADQIGGAHRVIVRLEQPSRLGRSDAQLQLSEDPLRDARRLSASEPPTILLGGLDESTPARGRYGQVCKRVGSF